VLRAQREARSPARAVPAAGFGTSRLQGWNGGAASFLRSRSVRGREAAACHRGADSDQTEFEFEFEFESKSGPLASAVQICRLWPVVPLTGGDAVALNSWSRSERKDWESSLRFLPTTGAARAVTPGAGDHIAGRDRGEQRTVERVVPIPREGGLVESFQFGPGEPRLNRSNRNSLAPINPS
jgi:hypothetical protein